MPMMIESAAKQMFYAYWNQGRVHLGSGARSWTAAYRQGQAETWASERQSFRQLMFGRKMMGQFRQDCGCNLSRLAREAARR